MNASSVTNKESSTVKGAHVVVKMLLRNTGGNILLLRRSATDTRRSLEWDLPGGMVEEGEDFVTGVVRETKEETGLTVQANTVRLVYTHTAMRDSGNVCWLFFVCSGNTTDVTISYEHDQAKWVTLLEGIEMIKYDLQRNFLIYLKDNKLLVE
ncbi:NUDIX hydrolase [Candidatus Saccharibacteria bacterium]|nr:NUDIX hydrolase [Candidatus Saccharibacteria bacterium]MBI3338075.1 NUDIX hydrolase [Candidatus Saccharibacteria bacterium]